ncbi:hypothetical protein AWB79_07506 [Caballeronia hypogeia]|uniref:Lipoprotein n=1 Tax=Caballeronia hypogeia TaxID=1777140 RepID=A0A158DT03_9BURK|nr:hypothetical protein [Caballeronia hypogeia]SAK97714.1 hypothetical protein AWB79_07506 [Caballeronia hypogeia]
MKKVLLAAFLVTSTIANAKTWYSFNPLDHDEPDCVKPSTDPIQDMWRRYGKGNTHTEQYGTIADKTVFMWMSGNTENSMRSYFDSLQVCRESRRAVLTRLDKDRNLLPGAKEN